MNNLTTFYRSRLPHFTPIGGTFFVTFRLQNALPLAMMQALKFDYLSTVRSLREGQYSPARRKRLIAKARYDYFRTYDGRLDESFGDGCILRDPTACELLATRLHHFDDKLYDLKAYCIMPNHVHLLISLLRQTVDEQSFVLNSTELQSSYQPLHEVMRLIKGGSLYEINQYLGRRGTLWQADSYDHFVRNAKAYDNILHYILYNPEKAGLVDCWRDYPFTYYS